MQNANRGLWIAFLLTEIGCLAPKAYAQVDRPNTANAVAAGKDFGSNAPSLDLQKAESLRGSVSLTATDRQRAQSYNSETPIPLYDLKKGRWRSGVEYQSPFTVDPLPSSTSDLVLTATTLSADVHLSEDGSRLYTTYALTPGIVLKGSIAGINSPIIADRIGGVANLPDGTKSFVGISGKGLPEPHHNYLFFLRKTPVSGVFEILTGFCLDSGHVSALDRSGDNLDALTPSALIHKIQATK